MSIITLTKQSATSSPASVADKAAGAPEIEVTPKMLAAGVHVIAEVYGLCMEDIAEDLAADVYRAMATAT